MPGIRNQGNGNKYIIIKKNGDNQYYYIKNKRVQSLYKDDKDISTSAILRNKILKIGPQCVRVATAFLFALVCEYGAV